MATDESGRRRKPSPPAATVPAPASTPALRCFGTAGDNIPRAVIDADHPHCGMLRDGDERHAPRPPGLAGLHRCSADIREERDGIMIARPPLLNADGFIREHGDAAGPEAARAVPGAAAPP